MRTRSQFAKIGVPLIVVSVLVGVAIILAVALSKKSSTKGKFDLLWIREGGCGDHLAADFAEFRRGLFR